MKRRRWCVVWMILSIVLALSACGAKKVNCSTLLEEKMAQSEILQNSQNVSHYDNDIYLSPFVKEEELEELVLAMEEISKDRRLDRSHADFWVLCYSAQIMYVDLSKQVEKDQLLKELQERVSEQKTLADQDNDGFHKYLFAVASRDEKGQCYFVIREKSFEEDCRNLQRCLDTIYTRNPVGKQNRKGYCYTYYIENGKVNYVGYTGESFALYKEGYYQQNKMGEYCFFEIGNAFDDIFRNMIFDYRQIEPRLENGIYQVGVGRVEGRYFSLNVSWKEYGEHINIDDLTDYTYALYNGIRSAQDSIQDVGAQILIHIDASASEGELNVYKDTINCRIRMKEDFTREQWKINLESNFTREFEMIPR